jgi:hypothetical protein
MKMFSRFLTAGFLALGVFLAGCASTTPVPYSCTEKSSKSASVVFSRGNPDVKLVYFNDNEIPDPEEGTCWNPVSFPTGEALKLTVHAYYEQSSNWVTSNNLLANLIAAAVTSASSASRHVDAIVEFSCPPLDSGKEYKLAFQKGYGLLSGKNTLILTDITSKKVICRQTF